VADPGEDAYEKLVERYLASPQYGERWGRYWLDLARYADVSNNGGPSRRRPGCIAIGSCAHGMTICLMTSSSASVGRGLASGLSTGRLGGAGILGTQSVVLEGIETRPHRHQAGRGGRVEERIEAIGATFLGLTLACADATIISLIRSLSRTTTVWPECWRVSSWRTGQSSRATWPHRPPPRERRSSNCKISSRSWKPNGANKRKRRHRLKAD